MSLDGPTRTSMFLQPLEKAGHVILRDRRIPRSRSTIDHIVIGPGAVWVIQPVSWRGRLQIRGSELLLGGRRAPMADQVVRHATAVQRAAHVEPRKAGVTARPVLCFHQASLPWSGREVRNVAVTDGPGLAHLIQGSSRVLDALAVETIGAILDRAVLPQTRAAGK